MVYAKCVSEPHQETIRRRIRVVYVQRMEERRVFMEELAQLRSDRMKRYLKIMKDAVGPIWYHALSVKQRCALDALAPSIYQDILEGRPYRTRKVVHRIGLYPPPKYVDLMAAVYAAQKDAMQLFAYLFLLMFGHVYAVKRPVYSLNAKLLLSCLFYVGLEGLIRSLEETFKPDKEPAPPKSKRKRKPSPPPISPYLEKTTVKMYYPQSKKAPKPAPLPDLSSLRHVVVVPPEVIPKPPPPPPRTIMPRESKPRDHCDKIAGLMRLQPFKPVRITPFKTFNNRMPRRRFNRISRANIGEKKTYGLNLAKTLKRDRHKKPRAPKTGLERLQHHIVGVYTIDERTFYILGNVVSLPIRGFIIHGGFCVQGGVYVRIHGGCTDRPLVEWKDPCDCLDRWEEAAIKYVSATKCRCGHHYDFGHEGTFSPEDVPYFDKSTGKGRYQFNYSQIYELDPRALYVGKEFKRIWDTESILGSEDEDVNQSNKKKKKKVNLRDETSYNCLGDNPQLTDYLQCALASYKTKNMAARLPDVHLAPELKEWIRRRIYGNFTRQRKKEMLLRSTDRWVMLSSAEGKGLGHVHPPIDPVIFFGCTTWDKKEALRERFDKYYKAYKRRLFKSQVNVNNLLWATMFHEEFPDKKFREIFFSYLLERTQDLQLTHPYNTKEATERAMLLDSRRVVCAVPKLPYH